MSHGQCLPPCCPSGDDRCREYLERAVTDHATNTENEADPAVARLTEEIRRLRKDADLSHAQLAGQIDYSRQYVSLAERPRKSLPSADLVRALDALCTLTAH